MQKSIILGTPFLTLLYPFSVDQRGIHTEVANQRLCFEFIDQIHHKEIQQNTLHLLKQKRKQIKYLAKEIYAKNIEEQLTQPEIQQKIKILEDTIKQTICADTPNAFWSQKKHQITLPYIKNFDEKQIPTKARPIQMNQEMLAYCQKEIQTLLEKKLIRPSKSPWSCAAFYVNNQAELERGVPRLVINYKPLNKVLEWIRYPIPNKKDLLNRLYKAIIFSKFDMKSGFWQIQIKEKTNIKLHLMYLLANMNGMSCHSV